MSDLIQCIMLSICSAADKSIKPVRLVIVHMVVSKNKAQGTPIPISPLKSQILFLRSLNFSVCETIKAQNAHNLCARTVISFL